MFYRNERLGLVIDGGSMHRTTRALNFEGVDFGALRKYFSERGILVRSLFCTTHVIREDSENDAIQPLLDWLNYNGFTLVVKELRGYKDTTGQSIIRGTIDVELTVATLELAQLVDHIVLFSGNNDLEPLVLALTRGGTRVTIVTSIKGSDSVASGALRRAADDSIDLVDLQGVIEKKQTKVAVTQ